MRTRTTTSGTSGYRQIHSDIHQTVYSRSPRESYGRDSRYQQDRTTSSITLRSRSRSKRTHRTHQSFMDRRHGIHLYPRSQFESTSAMTPPTYREPSQSEAESAQVPIPLPAAVDQPDWNRSSQERERNDDTEDGEDQLIPIPTTRSLEADWKISVQKAFDDPTRTKAPCEISEANTIKLVSNVSKRRYDSFVRILSTRTLGIPPHLKKLLETWRQFLLTLVRWHRLRLRDPTPLKSQMLWASDCSSLHTSGQRNHSKTMTPMCTTFFMALQTKEHLLSLLRNWFDLGTSPSARTWQTVDILPTDSIQQEKLRPKLSNSLPAPRSWPGRFWRLEKELCQSLLEGSTLDAINISIKCLEEMKKFKDFVENVVLPEEKKNTWWQDQNIQLFMAWWSPTRMLFDHLAIPWALENSSPCSICRGTNYSLWTYQRSSTPMTMGLQLWQLYGHGATVRASCLVAMQFCECCLCFSL